MLCMLRLCLVLSRKGWEVLSPYRRKGDEIRVLVVSLGAGDPRSLFPCLPLCYVPVQHLSQSFSLYGSDLDWFYLLPNGSI